MPAVPSPPAALVTTTSAEATFELAAGLAVVAQPGDLICLWGELGAGKTVFAKGFGQGLGVSGVVSSPSFILMAEHRGRLPLFHIDLYRLAGVEDAFSSGLIDERQADGVTLIEWPDRLGSALPADRLDVRIDGTGDAPRQLELAGTGDVARRYIEAVG
jgi:tRNA threonylcarbamoyladenosine biosynthesis protein TsaE